MHPSLDLFKLSLVIFLSIFQSCNCKKHTKSLPQQLLNYTVSLTPANTTGYFEDHRMPIHFLFLSSDENRKSNNVRFRIKKISIEGVSGHLETETGESLKAGSDFVYNSNGHKLFFVPDANSVSGYCAITLAIFLVGKDGNDVPESSHKVVNCQICICHKKDVTKQDTGLFVKATCNQDIILIDVGGAHLLGDEEWTLEGYSFQDGLKGELGLPKSPKVKRGVTTLTVNSKLG